MRILIRFFVCIMLCYVMKEDKTPQQKLPVHSTPEIRMPLDSMAMYYDRSLEHALARE